MINVKYPQQTYIKKLLSMKFQTLNLGINEVHKIKPSYARYCLKSINGMSMTYFQCQKINCTSHIIFKMSFDMEQHKYFQIVNFNNQHYHLSEMVTDPGIKQIAARQQIWMINNLQNIKSILKDNLILIKFRDFISYFEFQQKDQNHCQSYLPYKLPQMVKQKHFTTTFRINYKLINARTKIYLYMIEVWILDQFVTEIKYINYQRQQSVELILYLMTLIYISTNNIASSQIQMPRDIGICICNPLPNSQYLKAIFQIQANFISVNNQFKNKQKGQYLSDQNSQKQISVTIKQIQKHNLKRLNNKLSMAKQKYDQTKLSKRQTRFYQQKPSTIRKLNLLFQCQQQKRVSTQLIKKLPIKKSFANDNNIIDLQSQEEIPQDKSQNIQIQIKTLNQNYLNSQLDRVQPGFQFSGLVEFIKEKKNVQEVMEDFMHDN